METGMIERKSFFGLVRNSIFPGMLGPGQVDGMNRILDEWERRNLTDLRHLAYMLATVYWETAHTMQPIREMGGEEYLRSKKYYPWVGEGLVQVTWESNHRKYGATAPGQLMTWPKALKALFDGMIEGHFTNKKLSHYFGAGVSDWVNARRIINGIDRAQEIAAIARKFYSALLASKANDPPRPDVVPPPPRQMSWLDRLLNAIGASRRKG